VFLKYSNTNDSKKKKKKKKKITKQKDKKERKSRLRCACKEIERMSLAPEQEIKGVILKRYIKFHMIIGNNGTLL
jgi:hypothetical protein